MLPRPWLLLVVLPLAGATAWVALTALVFDDDHLDRPFNLLAFLPLALPALVTLATTLHDRSSWTALLWTAYSVATTVLFVVFVLLILLCVFFATDPDTGCPDHRIYC